MAAAVLVYFALFCTSLVFGQDGQCDTQTSGDTNQIPVLLHDVYLPPPELIWDITIPDPCEAPSRKVGVKVKACDPQGPPSVNILSINEAIVQRNNYPVTTTAAVSTTIYCSYFYRPRADANVVKVVPVRQ